MVTASKKGARRVLHRPMAQTRKTYFVNKPIYSLCLLGMNWQGHFGPHTYVFIGQEIYEIGLRYCFRLDPQVRQFPQLQHIRLLAL